MSTVRRAAVALVCLVLSVLALCGVATAAPAGGDPQGSLELIAGGPGSVHVKGWAFDPNRPNASIDVAVFVDGGQTRSTTDVYRPDVNAAHPGMTGNHGVDLTIPVPGDFGSDRVCVYAINVAGTKGTDLFFGCSTVRVTPTWDATVGPIAPAPERIAVDHYSHEAFVLHDGVHGNVSVVDTVHNALRTTIGVGAYPRGLALDQERHRLFVTNLGSTGGNSSISVIDTETDRVVWTTSVRFTAVELAIDTAHHRLWVTSTDDLIHVFDEVPDRIVEVTAISGVRNLPRGIAIDPNTDRAYVAGQLGAVYSYDTDTYALRSKTRFAHALGSVAIDTATRNVFVNSDDGDPTIQVIAEDTGAVTAVATQRPPSVPSGGRSRQIAVDADLSFLYVPEDDGLEIFDSRQLTRLASVHIPVAMDPVAVDIDPDTRFVYLACGALVPSVLTLR